MKRISIIVPVLNEREALQRNLPLLQGVREGGHEIIVVDGGSTDDSVTIASTLADYVIRSKAGRAHQMNAGAAVAHGEILLFLHIDTELPADAMALIQESLRQLTAVWGRFDVRLSGSRRVFRIIEALINLRSRVSGVATGDQAIFVRSARFRQVSGFPDLSLMEDVALSKTLRRLASPICLRARVTTSSRRWEQHGVVHTVLLMWWLRLLYFCGIAPQKLHDIYIRKKK